MWGQKQPTTHFNGCMWGIDNWYTWDSWFIFQHNSSGEEVGLWVNLIPNGSEEQDDTSWKKPFSLQNSLKPSWFSGRCCFADVGKSLRSLQSSGPILKRKCNHVYCNKPCLLQRRFSWREGWFTGVGKSAPILSLASGVACALVLPCHIVVTFVLPHSR